MTADVVRQQLEAIMARVDLYKEKNFKKLSAKQAIKDFEFLFFVITVVSSANEEMKRMLSEQKLLENDAVLVNSAGQPLSTDLQATTPQIII